MKHELLTVPFALAETNGRLRSGSKADFAQVLTLGINCPPSIGTAELGETATFVVDAQATICSIGKPPKATTFGDLADEFIGAVLHAGAFFKRIDVVFDRYYEKSIKEGTRTRRGQGSGAIRRLIEGRNVPLPAKWETFMAHPKNKADLANFLSQQLMLQAPSNKTVVVSGGFIDEEQVESSDPEVITDTLKAQHEEADTRMILHCTQTQASSIVIATRDTDVLVLLLAHFHKIPSDKVWLRAGTSANRKHIPIHTIVEQLAFSHDKMESITAFHAITGCDTASYLFRHTKNNLLESIQRALSPS